MRIHGGGAPTHVTPENEKDGRRAVIAAYEAGYTLFDHADIYGRGVSEKIFGDALREVSGMRERIVIATKCGVRNPGDPLPESPHRYDFSAEHILRSCDASLKRLGVEQIDIYQLHRPDLLMDPQEVAGAFTKLREHGKVREFGVSNFAPSFLAALQAHLPMPLIVNQVQIHLGDLGCFYDGTLDQCIAERITPMAWSPLGMGMFGDGGIVDPEHPKREGVIALQNLLDRIAAKYGVSRTVMALAWLLKHPSGIIPIVGSTKPDHVRDAAKADTIDMDREDWYRLLVAARMQPLP